MISLGQQINDVAKSRQTVTQKGAGAPITDKGGGTVSEGDAGANGVITLKRRARQCTPPRQSAARGGVENISVMARLI
jgi:hypothetical protein